MMLQLEMNEGLKKLPYEDFELRYAEAYQRFINDYSSGVVGFPDTPFDDSQLRTIVDYADFLRNKFSTLVVLGVGGSSLGGQTIVRALEPKRPAHSVLFFDNIDPDVFCPSVENLNMKKTAIFIVSKSGSTMETWAQWLFIEPILKNHVGARWADHVVVCTDPQRGDLLKFAQEKKLRCLFIPPNLGGRFSVLSPVGLLPAAFCGFNINQLLEGAAHLGKPHAWDQKLHPDHVVPNLVRALMAGQKSGYQQHVLMSYCHRLDRFCDWFVQLWAESLGKTLNGVPVGSTPIRALGVTDQHSQMQLFMQGPKDKVIGFLWNSSSMNQGGWGPIDEAMPASARVLEHQSLRQLLQYEFLATRRALSEVQRPWYSLHLESLNERSLGELFFLYEAVTTLTGYMMGINPLDQPGVERAKILAKEHIENGR